MGSSLNRLKKLLHMSPTTPINTTPTTSAEINAEITKAIDNMATTTVSSTIGDYLTTTMDGADWVSVGSYGGAGGGGIINTTGVTYTIPATGYTTGTSYIMGGGGFTFSPPAKTNIVAYNDIKGKEIVRLNLDGSVTWSQDIPVDEAAENFARTLSIGAEISAGLTQKVKLKMRDSVFEDLINIAKEKGSLTAEDLTYLLEASKIVEKLKGAKD